jgi:coenzyme F420 hydrogenase subunit beta
MMRRLDSIDKVVNRHLCMGCGACAAARPDLVTMIDTESHGRRPRLRKHASKAENQALARICPGREIRFDPANDYDSAAWGPVLQVWEGHAVDPELRFRGSSGGVVSALALHRIESGAAAGVVQVRARKDEPLLNETVISRSRDDVLAASASRYSPASPCERLADVRADGRKHIFVGKPCDVAGANKLMRKDERLRNSIGLTVSIFCAGTPSQRATKQLIQALDIHDRACIDEVRYRGEGWPGRMAVHYRETAESAPKRSSMTYAKGWGEILQKHTQWRCRMCADHLGEHADLSVGDPWYRPIGENEQGESLIVVRTERGRQALREAVASGYLVLERRSLATLAASQPNLERTKGAVFGRCLTVRAVGGVAPIYRGGALHRVWLRALSPVAKLQSIGGTLKRILKKRILRPERAVGLHVGGEP